MSTSERRALNPVEILLSTYNGRDFLPELLESFKKQDCANVQILVRDDGSKDGSCEILSQFSSELELRVIEGINLGLPDSYFSLLRLSSSDVSFYAFADQDDVWRPEKLSRAISCLEAFPGDCPVMYCSAVTLVDAHLRVIGKSRPLRRVASFENALVQNVATGCTIVMNRSARDLLLLGSPQHARMHDWWAYLVISALGVVVYDPWESLLYRQHEENAIGVRSGWARWANRARRHLSGQGLPLIMEQAQDFQRIYGQHLRTDRAKALDRFISCRDSLPARFRYVLSSEVYRQSRIDNIILHSLILLNWI